MRFMIMHKNDPQTEAGLPPPMELVTKMGAFIGEYAKTGRFIDGAGLGERASHRFAKALGRAGDEGNFAVKAELFLEIGGHGKKMEV